MDVQVALRTHKEVKEKALRGRYILPSVVFDLTAKLSSLFDVQTVGISVEKRPIQTVTFGDGKMRILMWSQMHGNESTTTKSLFDFFNYIQSNLYPSVVRQLLESCTFCIIPMLNPDGSQVWTRENANGVDLNRDAQLLTQPESKLLRETFDRFQPDYCFNLHGQRTIYGFEDTGMPSVLSFLAPAASGLRDFTLSRKRAASVISHTYSIMNALLPGQIGRYNDTYNADCVGDTFQEKKVSTILFEAGHFPQDYAREITRAYVFLALIASIEAVVSETSHEVEAYTSIPEHSKCFCDIHKDVEGEKVPLRYRELLEGEAIRFDPIPLERTSGSGLYAHNTVKEFSSFLI